MNRRNREIFGWEGKRGLVIGIIALVLIAGIGYMFWGQDKEKSNIISGATAVQNIPEQKAQQVGKSVGENVGESIEEEQVSPPIVQEKEQKEFIEYGGKCASDVKGAEDDVADVKGFLGSDVAERNRLQAEYDQKSKELEEVYTPQIERVKGNIAEAEVELKRTQANLDVVRAVCEF